MISRGDSLDRIYLIKLFGFGLFLHRIHTSDALNIFHSHPWNGYSLIFGRYVESFFNAPDVKHVRIGFNRIVASRHHRVEVNKPVWTLFFHLRKNNKWSVKHLDGNTVETPWDGLDGHKSYQNELLN